MTGLDFAILYDITYLSPELADLADACRLARSRSRGRAEQQWLHCP